MKISIMWIIEMFKLNMLKSGKITYLNMNFWPKASVSLASVCIIELKIMTYFMVSKFTGGDFFFLLSLLIVVFIYISVNDML